MWRIEYSVEVGMWLRSLSITDLAAAQRKLDLLAAEGPMLRMPHAKYLGQKLYELRFASEGVNRRITYTFDPPRKVITLTTFRKQRQNEAREVARARKALKRHRAAAKPEGDEGKRRTDEHDEP
ncbi:type II toxin-antitoxin system RelE/ParE family toxin [Nocardia carnea]|uniref:type II toxin-antitoxin system RelE/ParE family toxin n=1 Tax=Nocardia carnea TaxID=37328 RepID=UPI002456180C|nr:type II toxin-antitoxin system RelE/ParE family toxin [Nocardia carnea]